MKKQQFEFYDALGNPSVVVDGDCYIMLIMCFTDEELHSIAQCDDSDSDGLIEAFGKARARALVDDAGNMKFLSNCLKLSQTHNLKFYQPAEDTVYLFGSLDKLEAASSELSGYSCDIMTVEDFCIDDPQLDELGDVLKEAYGSQGPAN